MKKFNHTTKGQYRALASVTQNARVKIAPVIADNMELFATAYRNYLRNQGNPWKMTGYVPDSELRAAMAHLYASKIREVQYVHDLRKASRGHCCSMCGSLNSSQVDHFLPQKHYPEFSVFLPNLFPICSCNQAKGNKTIGPNRGDRFLHPKYDRKIGERSLYVRIRNHDDVPTYTVVARKPKGVRDALAFKFHTRTLVSHEALSNYVKQGFERFCRRPGNVITRLNRENPASKEALLGWLRDEIRESCWQHQSKNNWESVFLQALIERRTVKWIWKQISAPDRVPGAPLVQL